MTSTYDTRGVLRRWEDDVERLTHSYDESGSEILPPEEYTPEQNLAADWRAEVAAAQAEADALKAAVKLVITDARDERQLLDSEFTVIDATTGDPRQASNAEIKDSPGKYIKANKRANMRTLAALIDLSKLLDLTP